MSKKLVFPLILVLLIGSFTVAPVSAKANNSEKDNGALAEKVRSEIARLGTGPDARVEVKLNDKTKLKGYVSESDETRFVVIESGSGESRTVMYPQARNVKGNNLHTGVKIAIGVGIAVLALVLFCSFHGCEE